MSSLVLRPNAVPVYTFLSFILARQSELSLGKKILDCGAGGPLPPLALFRQHGFEAWGIDASNEQLQRAWTFCEEHDFELHLQWGDMREIPFADETFDFVYEQYSMCHLTKHDTAVAVGEMQRVLKKGGLCLLGVISTDTWPPMGREVKPGEFSTGEDSQDVVHSAFTDEEADQLVGEWKVLQKVRRTSWYRERTTQITQEEWIAMYDQSLPGPSRDEWLAMYNTRDLQIQHTHLFFYLQKPL